VQGLAGGGVAQGDLVSPPKLDSSAQLRTADLVVVDRDVQTVIIDLEVLIDLVKVSERSLKLSMQFSLSVSKSVCLPHLLEGTC